MPPLVTRHRHEAAVLWPAGIYPDESGSPTVGNPIEIRVRWEERQQDVDDPLRGTIRLDAVVVVDREIAEGSRMWRGCLSAWPATNATVRDSELMEVVRYSETPDLKGRNRRRVVGLRRSRRNLPEAE